jgi:hypothetical protein
MHNQANTAAGLDFSAQGEPAQVLMVGFQKAVDPSIPLGTEAGGTDAYGIAMVHQAK